MRGLVRLVGLLARFERDFVVHVAPLHEVVAGSVLQIFLAHWAEVSVVGAFLSLQHAADRGASLFNAVLEFTLSLGLLVDGSEVSLLGTDVLIVHFAGVSLFNLLSDGKVVLSSFLRGYDFVVVHVDLLRPVVDFSSVELTVDFLSEVRLSHEVSSLLSANKAVHFCVHADVAVTEFALELVDADLSVLVAFDNSGHLFLLGVEGVASWAGLAGLSTMELDIIWSHRRVVAGLAVALLVESQMLPIKELTNAT